MGHLNVPVLELVVRAALIYIFLIAILRLSGKRQIGQLAPFDLVLLIMLSNAVQNSINAGDSSLIGGMISAVTLISMNWVVSYVTYSNKTLERLIEGKPQILVHNGHVDRKIMEAEKVTQHELEAALRSAGCASVADVRFAILENNGRISVQSMTKPARQAEGPAQ